MVSYKQWKLLKDCVTHAIGEARLVQGTDPARAEKLRTEAAELQKRADELQKEGIDFDR
jgi:hypothetical protein